MLDDLVRTIETLREHLRRYNLELSKNEIRTRTVLIDPMLEALGWDASDPALVTVEYEVPPGRADYGLRRGLDNPPVVLIEAKRLNEPLDPHLGQLLNYALVRGVRYGCLTDGNIWEVYDVFKQVPLEERKILSLAISDGEPAKVALAMLGLWQRSLQDGSLEQAVEPLVEVGVEAAPKSTTQEQAAMRYQPTSTLASSTPIVALTIGEAGWVPLGGAYPTTGYPPPSAIKLPGEESIDIKAWNKVPMEIALWLHRKALLTRENCRFTVAEKRYLFSPDGKHATGTAFHSPREVGNTGIQMEASFNPDKLVAYSCVLLQHFGQDTSQVQLMLR